MGVDASGEEKAFVWASLASAPPPQWDLRLLGWRMQAPAEWRALRAGIPGILDCRPGARVHEDRLLDQRIRLAAVGVDDPAERLDMLRAGFGEVLSSQVLLEELALRLVRMAKSAQALPRFRLAGPVRLDLVHRDAWADRGRVGLHPREFALLWRLAELPGAIVSRRDLLADVWRLRDRPQTNSLAVHVARLRTKLALAGAAGLVATAPDGGYRLALDGDALYSGLALGDEGMSVTVSREGCHLCNGMTA